MSFSIFSRSGVILPSSEATVPLSDIAYTYGFGVYESLRAVRGKALFVQDHLERLMHSASVLELEHSFTPATMTQWIEELLSKIEGDACNLKMLLIGGKDAASATLYILPLSPLFPDKRLYKQGASVLSVKYERYLPQAKTLNMLPSYLAYRSAKKAGCYDALLINRHECITEGTRTNFFAIRGRTLVSPPAEEILEGVTLKHVREVALKNGYTIEHHPIPLSDIQSFDGAFLTSTSSKIMPLSKVNDLTMLIPEALHELIAHFDAFLETAKEA